MLAPHPSLLIVLTQYHWKLLQARGWFVTHLVITYTLSFLAFSSLIVILARDPGPVQQEKTSDRAVDEDMDFTQALLSTNEDDMTSPGKWCRKCWAPKPPRTHQ